MQLPVMPPVAPMLAKVRREIPAGHLYEPKWDGFRSIVFRDGDEVEIGSRNERPMTRYFPELVAAIEQSLPERCVVDGEIVVASPEEGGGLDFWALQQRIHPAASRVGMLAEQTPASFVAFDLLALDDRNLMGEPFAARRAMLERLVPAGTGTGSGTGTGTGTDAAGVHLTPVTRDIEVAHDWFERFEGAGLDGLIAKAPDLTYQPNKRVMAKIKHERTADCVVAGYRVHTSTPEAVGSLLLGLYDDPERPHVPAEMQEWLGETTLVSVGVVGAFPMAVRRELYVELQPLVVDIEDHPWSWAAELMGPRRGGRGSPGQGRQPPGSRWNATKDLSFVPLRPERVVEVRYDYMEGFRFRHTAQFRRWRPDRDPRSCDFDQLDRPTPLPLADALHPPGH